MRSQEGATVCMKVFVTGGSGFVGGHLIERLVAAGHTVTAMARSASSAAAVTAYGATAVRCGLDDLAAAHLEGCEAVVHAAAYVEDWGPKEAYWEANVVGTERALAAARAAGASRFVSIGTEAAFFTGEALVGLDESAPLPLRQRFAYSETKAEAEKRVLAAEGEGFVTVSLRPRLVWGPRDATVLPTLVEMARRRAFVWLDGGAQKTSTCHVFNLCEAVRLSLRPEAPGGAYFVADAGETTVRAFLSALAESQGVSLGGLSLPGSVMRPVSAGLERFWRLASIEKAPPMTAFAIAMLSRSITVKTDKIASALGYRPVITRDEGLAALRV